MAKSVGRGDAAMPTQPGERRRPGYIGGYLDPEDEVLLDAKLAQEKIGKSEWLRAVCKAALYPPGGAPGGALLSVLSEFARAAAANSAGGNFLDDPVGFSAVGEMVKFLDGFPRPPGVRPVGEIPTPRRRAGQMFWLLGDPGSPEFAGNWAKRVAEGFGEAVMARLAEKHAADLARLEAMENREPPAPEQDIQTGWADAVMLSKDAGIEVATARSQISRFDRLPKAERLAAVKNMRRQILTWAGLDEAIKAELLAAIADRASAPIGDAC